MKKIFLLIISIFLLQSCSGIKIVIEKDCNCKCNENSKKLDTSLEKNNSFVNDNNFIENNEEKGKLIRYLTGKFIVSQDENYTYVYYKNIFIAKFINDISNFSEDELEEKSIIKDEKEILKRELAKKIFVKNIYKNFYLIGLENSGKNFLFDKQNNKTWNINFVKSKFSKIIFGNNGKYFMYSGGKKCDGGLIYIDNKTNKLKKIFENDCNYIGEYPENYKEITNFELGNGLIKVYYIDYLGDKNIEKIYLNEIK